MLYSCYPVLSLTGPYERFSSFQDWNPFGTGNSWWEWHRKRKRRQAEQGTVHSIELSMIADYSVWSKFLKFANKDENKAYQELQQYYQFMAVMMDIRYQSVTERDPTLIIRIFPVSLIVTDIQEESVWTERNKVGQRYVESVYALYSLRDWVRAGRGVPKADHTMLFSGLDLLGSGQDTSTIGVAFIGTACSYNSVSVIEEYFTGTTGSVSAHELGHSLDAEHDNNYRTCSDVSANVMSTQAVFPTEVTALSNPWKFSQCSVSAFGIFLDYFANCTQNVPEEYIETQEVGGVYFDADEQCRLAMGEGSYFCRSVQARKGFTNMCRRLYCYLPSEPGYCGSVIAAEYTVCGSQKWCYQGRCVKDSKAPLVPDSCPQGDEPGYQCTRDDCEAEKKVRDVLCCKTCGLSGQTNNDITRLNTTEGRAVPPSVAPPSSVPTTAETTTSSIAITTTSTTTAAATTSLRGRDNSSNDDNDYIDDESNETRTELLV
ncbi:metalloprotease mig-17 [Aplysia californica]|uniref:Metalloprotease mig-17 n=1 Tax=Aplysia californica TaxID=6500 RepID=A0ABM1AA35_APLCA|nr:metalloprotease mig-17 [Aplysia californica]